MKTTTDAQPNKSLAKPAQTLSAEAMKYITERQGRNNGGGHCQGGGGW